MRQHVPVFFACLLSITSPVAAKNFGTYGTVFPVTEPDFLEEILSRLRDMEQSGEMAAMQQSMQDTTRSYIERPHASAVLPPAEEYRAFQFDPSIVVERDIADHNGVVFAHAGTRVNPLDYSHFNKRIIIIDGDIEDQVEFALSDGNELDTLIVMINGAPLELGRAHGRRFWFDQNAEFIARFGVERLPTVITRADPFMLIEEVPTARSQP